MPSRAERQAKKAETSSKKGNMFNYPTLHEVEENHFSLERDKTHRSRYVYKFLSGINDKEEAKWWTMLCYPFLQPTERERLFKK